MTTECTKQEKHLLLEQLSNRDCHKMQTLSFITTKLGQKMTFPLRALIDLTLILKAYGPLTVTEIL